MAYQFIHVEAYSREASKQKTKGKGQSKGGLSVRDVIAEAGREPGNCPHVDQPQRPTVIYGSLDQAEAEAISWAEQATDQQGRKLRKDGHCLLAGVISLPRSEEESWGDFVKRSTAYLHAKYEDRLKAVVAHEKDEEHPHIHFYAVARKGERFEAIHEGQKAAKQAKAEGKLKGEQNAAYIGAMRGLQDDFSNQVGQPLGLTRLGPARRRLTRAAWQAEQTQAKALQQTLSKKNAYKKHYKKQALEEAKTAIDQAKEQAKAEGLAEAQKAGEKLGSVWSGIKDKLSKPSEREQQAIKQAQEAQTKAEEEARRAKVQADNRVTKVAEQLQAEKSKNLYLEKELKEAEQKLQDLMPAHQNGNRKGYGLK